MTNVGVLVFFLLCSSVWYTAYSQECSDDTLRRCRRKIRESLNANIYSDRNDVNDQCRSIRENFDCILWQTSMCLDKAEQEANGDVILKSWRYLGSFCEDQGSWWTKTCYQREDVKRCEQLLSTKGQTNDFSSCSSYGIFRDCVKSIVDAQCTKDDRSLLGTYLMDKGQQRAWRCPKNYDQFSSAGVASAPLAADTRFPMMSDSSYGSCFDDAKKPLQECLTTFEADQIEAMKYQDSDMRNHKSCCAMVLYEDCVANILKYRCGNDAARETRNIVSSVATRLYNSCRDHSVNECSGAENITMGKLIYLLLAAIWIINRAKN